MERFRFCLPYAYTFYKHESIRFMCLCLRIIRVALDILSIRKWERKIGEQTFFSNIVHSRRLRILWDKYYAFSNSYCFVPKLVPWKNKESKISRVCRVHWRACCSKSKSKLRSKIRASYVCRFSLSLFTISYLSSLSWLALCCKRTQTSVLLNLLFALLYSHRLGG